MGSQKYGPSIPPRIRMFFLTILTISERIISSEGQPMSLHCMNPPHCVYPLDGVLQKMMSHSAQGCPHFAVCPLVCSPHLPITCDAERYFLEPHTYEQRKRGKWKMVKPRITPWQPCVVGTCPQEVRGPRFHKYLCIKEDVVKNIRNKTLPDSLILSLPTDTGNGTTTPTLNITNEIVPDNSSLTNTGEEMALNNSKVGDENHNKVSIVTDDGNGWISSLCQSSMILFERYGHPNMTNCVVKFDNLTNLGATNVTKSSRMQTECESPSLVTLDCLACMLAKNSENGTVNGTRLMKKMDDGLDPVEYLEVGARISNNSSGSQNKTKLTKEEITALENCLADGNKSEPYLVNGRPLIVKFRYLNQTEKLFILTKKTGHDLLIAVPHEVGHEEGRIPTTVDRIPTTVESNVLLEQNVVPVEKAKDYQAIFDLSTIDQSGNRGPASALETLLIKAEINHMKDLAKGKVTRHTSTTPKIEESSTTEDQEDDFDFEKHIGYGGFSNRNRFWEQQQSQNRPNHGYAREMVPFASHLFRIPDYMLQPAFATSGIQMQEAMNGNNPQCTYFQTLRHSGRPNCPIDNRVSNYALNIATMPSNIDLSNEPRSRDDRKHGVKYENCRRIGCLEPENYTQRAEPTRTRILEMQNGNKARQNEQLTSELNEQTAEHDIDTNWACERATRPQCTQPDAVSWPRNCLGIQNFKPFPIVIQPQIVACQGRMY